MHQPLENMPFSSALIHPNTSAPSSSLIPQDVKAVGIYDLKEVMETNVCERELKKSIPTQNVSLKYHNSSQADTTIQINVPPGAKFEVTILENASAPVVPQKETHGVGEVIDGEHFHTDEGNNQCFQANNRDKRRTICAKRKSSNAAFPQSKKPKLENDQLQYEFVQLIKKYPVVLDTSRSKEVTDMKTQARASIRAEYEEICGICRTDEQISTKINNMKYTTKQTKVAERNSWKSELSDVMNLKSMSTEPDSSKLPDRVTPFTKEQLKKKILSKEPSLQPDVSPASAGNDLDQATLAFSNSNQVSVDTNLQATISEEFLIPQIETQSGVGEVNDSEQFFLYEGNNMDVPATTLLQPIQPFCGVFSSTEGFQVHHRGSTVCEMEIICLDDEPSNMENQHPDESEQNLIEIDTTDNINITISNTLLELQPATSTSISHNHNQYSLNENQSIAEKANMLFSEESFPLTFALENSNVNEIPVVLNRPNTQSMISTAQVVDNVYVGAVPHFRGVYQVFPNEFDTTDNIDSGISNTQLEQQPKAVIFASHNNYQSFSVNENQSIAERVNVYFYLQNTPKLVPTANEIPVVTNQPYIESMIPTDQDVDNVHIDQILDFQEIEESFSEHQAIPNESLATSGVLTKQDEDNIISQCSKEIDKWVFYEGMSQLSCDIDSGPPIVIHNYDSKTHCATILSGEKKSDG